MVEKRSWEYDRLKDKFVSAIAPEWKSVDLWMRSESKRREEKTERIEKGQRKKILGTKFVKFFIVKEKKMFWDETKLENKMIWSKYTYKMMIEKYNLKKWGVRENEAVPWESDMEQKMEFR